MNLWNKTNSKKNLTKETIQKGKKKARKKRMKIELFYELWNKRTLKKTLSYFTKIVLTLTNSLNPFTANSLPKPEALTPPKGNLKQR